MKDISSRDLIKDPITLIDISFKRGEFIFSALWMLNSLYSNLIPNFQDRIRFIWDNCIYILIDEKYKDGELIRRLYLDLKLINDEFSISSNFKKEHIYICSTNDMTPIENTPIRNMSGENLKMKFDIVIGNPPYQDPTTKKVQGSRKNPSKLWHGFIIIANKICAKDGIVALITPPNYTQPTNKSFKEVMSRTDLFINMDNKITKMLDVSIKTSYFVYRNKEDLSIKNVNFFDGSSNFQTQYKYGDMIPMIEFSKLGQSICNRVLNNDFEKYVFKSNQDEIPNFKNLPKIGNDQYKYPMFDFQATRFSKLKPRDFEKTKIIISEFLARRPPNNLLLPNIYLDEKGEYGCLYKKKGGYITFNSIISAKNTFFYLKDSKVMNFVFKQFSINSFMQSRVLESITKIECDVNITDEYLYNYFGLTPNEIDIIENNI